MTNVTKFIQHLNNLTPSGVGKLEKLLYSTFTYPYPSNNGQYTIKVFGTVVGKANYIIADITGRTIQEGVANFKQNIFQFNFNSTAANGNYFLSMFNDKGQKIISEKLNLQR